MLRLLLCGFCSSFLLHFPSNFTLQLVDARQGHKCVDCKQVIVDRVDLGAKSRPNQSSGGDCNLLRVRDKLSWPLEICNVGNGDAPFKCGSPEMNRFGSSWMIPKLL